MNPETFAQWFEAYGAAWIAQDKNRAGELFAEDAIYQETPFSDALRGRDAIRRYWKDTETQGDIDFGYEILSVTPNMGIAQWWASFTRLTANTEVRLDGIAVVSLNAQNLCVSFHEWWHRLETPIEEV